MGWAEEQCRPEAGEACIRGIRCIKPSNKTTKQERGPRNLV